MKAVVYSIRSFEKEYLAKANRKKHDITLIANPLGPQTAVYAKGKDAVILFTNDDASAPVINQLASYGIRFIITRSASTSHIDRQAAAAAGIKIANVPCYSAQAVAEHAVGMAFALNRQLTKAGQQNHDLNFRRDNLVGFNFSGKTIGIIGLGATGRAVAAIYHGMGCRVIGTDLNDVSDVPDVSQVSLEQLLQTADVISLHLPLTNRTRNFVNDNTLALMKPGVMLINTSHELLLDLPSVLQALEKRRVGYLGLDVHEFEEGLFFENNELVSDKDRLLARLMSRSNVIITPQQAYLTHEVLQQIADQTIKNLDLWQAGKCVGKACACAGNCAQNVQSESQSASDMLTNITTH